MWPPDLNSTQKAPPSSQSGPSFVTVSRRVPPLETFYRRCNQLRKKTIVARSSSLNLFGSISKLTKVLHLLVCGRSYLNYLSLKNCLAGPREQSIA